MNRKTDIKFLKKKKKMYINWRFFILCTLIFFSLFILTFRIIFLQIINTDHLIYEGDRRSLRIEPILNTRGNIHDRLGKPLAMTVLVNAVCADPLLINTKENIINNPRWKALSKVLSIPLSKISIKVHPHKKSRFIYLARQITPEIGDYIKKLKLPGIFLVKETKRYYPFGEIAAQLVGKTNIDGEGVEGIEKSFNLLLKGKPGKRKVRKDNKGQVVEEIPLIDKSSSTDVTLSINHKLQNIVYKSLDHAVKINKADSGTAVLIDVNTGEILSMANSPSYNPNNMKGFISTNMRNKAITDIFEPGSTVKPVVIMSALKLGLIKIDSVVNTQPYEIQKHMIKDVTLNNKLNIEGILKKSSNVGISKIALIIPFDELMNTYMKFGLGTPTKLGIIGEQQGIIPKNKELSDLEKATISFGYGLMITPLQLARLYAIIGSYGIYHPLSIIKVKNPIPEEKIFPEEYVKDVIKMLEGVSRPGGGGFRASVKGYRVAVKTGTTKKLGSKGVYVNQYIAYTAGIAPASNPKFSLMIMINNPKGKKYYGGQISAPVFSEIMQGVLKEMHVKPDNPLNKKISNETK